MNHERATEVFANAEEVNSAFSFVQQRFGRVPCRGCKGGGTDVLIVSSVVVASCPRCGTNTPIGPLSRFWSPGAASTARARR